MPLVGVLALQGDFREHLAALADAGAEVTSVRDARELAAVDGLAIPGGESTTLSRLIGVFGLDEPLRRRLADGMPCFATCAGLILLARGIDDGRPGQLALGAFDVTVLRNGYGRQVDSFETPVTLDGDDTPFPGMFIRAPRITDIGPAAHAIAHHGDDVIAVEQGGSIGMTFHPEMTSDRRLHERFLRNVAERASRSAA